MKIRYTIDTEMTPSPLCLHPDIKVHCAIDLMRNANTRHLPITNTEKKILGIVSENDLKRAIHLKGMNTPVHEIMTTQLYVCDQNTLIEDVIQNLLSKKISSALIKTQENKICGIFTLTDALHILLSKLKNEAQNNSIKLHFTPLMEQAIVG